jgi:phosphatidylglycerophosphatase A
MGHVTDQVKPGIRALPPGMTLTDPTALLATWFGTGLLRPAPGTFGSLAAIPFGYVIAMIAGPIGLAASAVLLMVIGTRAATAYGRKSGVVDDSSIVVDEVAGIWIAALAAQDNAVLWGIAFLLFRLFDIWKPWPASYFDRKSRDGFDVMMDDVIAGIYALLGVSIAALILLP